MVKPNIFFIGDSTIDSHAYVKHYMMTIVFKILYQNNFASINDYSTECAKVQSLEENFNSHIGYKEQYNKLKKDIGNENVLRLNLERSYYCSSFNAINKLEELMKNGGQFFGKKNYVVISVLGNNILLNSEDIDDDFTKGICKGSNLSTCRLVKTLNKYILIIEKLLKLKANVIILNQYCPAENGLFKRCKKITKHLTNFYRLIGTKYNIPIINLMKTYNPQSQYYHDRPKGYEPGYGISIYTAILINFAIQNFKLSKNINIAKCYKLPITYEYYIDYRNYKNFFNKDTGNIEISEMCISLYNKEFLELSNDYTTFFSDMFSKDSFMKSISDSTKYIDYNYKCFAYPVDINQPIEFVFRDDIDTNKFKIKREDILRKLNQEASKWEKKKSYSFIPTKWKNSFKSFTIANNGGNDFKYWNESFENDIDYDLKCT